MNLLEDLKMSLLNFSFIMIYAIYKIIVLIKNRLYLYRLYIGYIYIGYNRLLFFFFFNFL